jgi:hypothetical protein
MSKRKKRPASEEPWEKAAYKSRLPIVFELKNCRQLSADHWRGTDVDGTIVDVKDGAMPVRGGVIQLKNSGMPKSIVVATDQYRPTRDGGLLTKLALVRLTRSA